MCNQSIGNRLFYILINRVNADGKPDRLTASRFSTDYARPAISYDAENKIQVSRDAD